MSATSVAGIMTTQRTSLLLTLVLAGAGCRKEFPAGFNTEYLEQAKQMAHDATAACDRLLEDEECFDGMFGDPKKSLPRPEHPFGGTALLLSLRIQCDHPTRPHSCIAPGIDKLKRYDSTNDCGGVPFRGWRVLNEEDIGEAVIVGNSPKCSPLFHSVKVQRRSPKRARLTLYATFAVPPGVPYEFPPDRLGWK